MRSPPSGCSLGPPTSILVIHSSPSRSLSRQTTELSGQTLVIVLPAFHAKDLVEPILNGGAST